MKTYQNKKEFLSALSKELNRNGVLDKEEILADFEQHFLAGTAKGKSEAEVSAHLGDVVDIAKQYADNDLSPAIAPNAPNSANQKKNNRTEERIIIREVAVAAPIKTTKTETAQAVSEQNENRTEEIQIEKKEEPLKMFGEKVVTTASVGPLVLEEIEEVPVPETAAAPFPTEPPPPVPPPTPAPMPQARQFTPPPQRPAAPQRPVPPPRPMQPPPSPRMQQNPPPRQPMYNNQHGQPGGPGNNVSVSGLIACLCIDCFVFSWAIPALAGLIFGLFGITLSCFGGAMELFFENFFSWDFSFWHVFSGIPTIANIIGGVALLGLTGLLVLASIQAVKAFIKVIKGIINWHGTSIVGRKVFQDKPKNKGRTPKKQAQNWQNGQQEPDVHAKQTDSDDVFQPRYNTFNHGGDE